MSTSPLEVVYSSVVAVDVLHLGRREVGVEEERHVLRARHRLAGEADLPLVAEGHLDDLEEDLLTLSDEQVVEEDTAARPPSASRGRSVPIDTTPRASTVLK